MVTDSHEEQDVVETITDHPGEHSRQLDHIKEFENLRKNAQQTSEVQKEEFIEDYTEDFIVLSSTNAVREEIPRFLACRASPVLRAMFCSPTGQQVGWKESEQKEVVFREVDDFALTSLASYIRTGSATISGATAISLLDAANALLITPLYLAVLEWIEKKLVPPNALALYQVGRLYNFASLKVKAWEMLGLYDFTTIFTLSPAWRELDIGTLKSLLEGRKRLTVCCEGAVVEALEEWCKVNVDERKSAFELLMCDASAVQLGHLSKQFWNSRLSSSNTNPTDRVASSVLNLQAFSKAFCPNWSPIRSISFDGTFTECPCCSSICYMTFSSSTNLTDSDHNARFCENCIRDKSEQYRAEFPLTLNSRANKSRRKSSGSSTRSLKKLFTTRKSRVKMDEEEDMVHLIVTSKSFDTQARRYTWPDALDSANRIHPIIKEIRNSKLRSGSYEVNSFLGGNRMSSGDLQVYVSTHSEVTGNGQDEMGNYVIEGTAFGNNISLTKSYTNSIINLNLAYLENDEEESCIFAGSWHLNAASGGMSSQSERQKWGFYWMKWRSIRNEMDGDIPKTLSEHKADLSLHEIILDGNVKKRIYLGDSLTGSTNYSYLEISLLGGQPSDLCGYMHKLILYQEPGEERNSKDPPTLCSVCGISYRNTNPFPIFDSTHDDSGADSIAPSPPPPPTLTSTDSIRDSEDETKEEDEEIGSKAGEETPKQWYTSSETTCPYFVCGDCKLDAEKNGSFPQFSKSPQCVRHHGLEGPKELDEEDLEVICQACASSISSPRKVHSCSKCGTNSNSHFYCDSCFDLVKVYGRAVDMKGKEEFFTGLVHKECDGLYLVGEYGLKVQLYGLMEEDRIFACIFGTHDNAVVIVDRISDFVDEEEHDVFKNALPTVKMRSFDTHDFSLYSYGSCCESCKLFRSNLNVDNALQILLAAIRDGAIELEASAEQFIVANYAEIVDRADCSLFYEVLDLSIVVATRIGDRLLRSEKFSRRFIRDIESIFEELCEKLDNEGTVETLCSIAELCALSMSSLRYEMLWVKMDAAVQERTKATILKALVEPKRQDQIYCSIASRLVSSLASVLLPSSESWPEFISTILAPLLDGEDNTPELPTASITLALQTLCGISCTVFDISTNKKLLSRFMRRMVGEGQLKVKEWSLKALHERIRNLELSNEELEETILGACDVLKSEGNFDEVKKESLALLVSAVNSSSQSRNIAVNDSVKRRVFDVVISLIRETNSQPLIQVLEFWNGLGDLEELRTYLTSEGEESSISMLIMALVESLFAEVEDVLVTPDTFKFKDSTIEAIISLLNELVFCVDNNFFDILEVEPTIQHVVEKYFPAMNDSWKNQWIVKLLFGVFFPILEHIEGTDDSKSLFHEILSRDELELTTRILSIVRDVLFTHRALIESEIPVPEPVSNNLEENQEQDEQAEMEREEIVQRREMKLELSREDCSRLEKQLQLSWIDYFIFSELISTFPETNSLVKQAQIWSCGRVFLWRNPCTLVAGVDNSLINMATLVYIKKFMLDHVKSSNTSVATTAAIRMSDAFDMPCSIEKSSTEQGRIFREELTSLIVHVIKDKMKQEVIPENRYFWALNRLALKNQEKFEMSLYKSDVLGIIQTSVLLEDSEMKYRVQINIMKALIESIGPISASEENKILRSGSLRTLEIAISVCEQGRIMFEEYSINAKNSIDKLAVVRSSLYQLQNDAIIHSVLLIYTLMKHNALFVWTQKERIIPFLLKWLNHTDIEDTKGELNISALSSQILSFACAKTSPDWLKRDAGVIMNTTLHALAERDHHKVVDASLVYLIGDVCLAMPSIIEKYMEKMITILRHLADPEYVQLCMRSGIRNHAKLREQRDLVKRAILTTCAGILRSSKSRETNPLNPYLDWIFGVIDIIVKEQELPGNYWELELATVDEDRELEEKDDVEENTSGSIFGLTDASNRKSKRVSTASSTYTIGSMYSSPDDEVFLRGTGEIDYDLCELVVYVVQLIEEKCSTSSIKQNLNKLKDNVSAIRRFVEKQAEEREKKNKIDNIDDSKSSISFNTENDLNEEYDLDNVLDRGNNPFFHQFPFRLRRG